MSPAMRRCSGDHPAGTSSVTPFSSFSSPAAVSSTAYRSSFALIATTRIVAKCMSSGSAPTLRGVRRLRTLSETECYIRLYGGWDPTVTLVNVEPRRPRYDLPVSGEDLRRDFEARIDARTEELIAERDAAEAAAEAA